MSDFEPYLSTYTVVTSDSSTMKKSIEPMLNFLKTANGAVLLIYDGLWNDYNICNYIDEITEEDGNEGEWAFHDESYNIYEFLENVDQILKENPTLYISVTTVSEYDPIWTQRLLERRATANQLKHVRIVSLTNN